MVYCLKEGVSSEKKKKNFATISLRFRISLSRKKCENFRFIREISLQSVSQKNAKKIMRKFCEKIMRKFCEKIKRKFSEKINPTLYGLSFEIKLTLPTIN